MNEKSQFNEEEPFLPGRASETDDDSMIIPNSSNFRKPRHSFIQRHYLMYFVHLGIFSVYSAGFLISLFALGAKYKHGSDALPNQLGRSALVYEPVHFQNDYHKMNTYFGEPSPAKEHAWHEFLAPSTVRIPASFMQAEGRDKGIQIPGGDYIGTTTVYHDLHCLKKMWWLIYPEYFYANASDMVLEMSRGHAKHCMSKLRQSIMCHGDTSPITYQFGPKQAIPLGNSSSPHLCVNWDRLDGWARENMVDPYEPGLVVHPVFGPAYADQDDISRTGVVHDEQEET